MTEYPVIPTIVPNLTDLSTAECSRTRNYPIFDQLIFGISVLILIILSFLQFTVHKTRRFGLVSPVDLRLNRNTRPYILPFAYSCLSLFRILATKHPLDLFDPTFAAEYPDLSSFPISAEIPQYLRTLFIVFNVIFYTFQFYPIFACIEFTPAPIVSAFIGILYNALLLSSDVTLLIYPCLQSGFSSTTARVSLAEFLLFFLPLITSSGLLQVYFVYSFLRNVGRCVWKREEFAVDEDTLYCRKVLERKAGDREGGNWHFRYSSRFLSAVVISCLFVYMVRNG